MSALKKRRRGKRIVRDVGFLLVLLTVCVFASSGDESVRSANSMLTPSRAPLLKPRDPNGLQETMNVEYEVELIPQPDKNSCWAASMAMLLSYRRGQSIAPGALAEEVGETLMMSYGWDLLEAVRDRYGFVSIDVPQNSSLYFEPEQWMKWLRDRGPLWVVVVGAPHAVVVSGMRGDIEDTASCEVLILDPWDSRETFDDDPVDFHPANTGYAAWVPFEKLAADFGDIAKFDKDLTYEGNWRVLWLPKEE